MARFLSIVLLSLSCLQIHAQKNPVKFGDIPIEDMKMTSWEKDTSAIAVVLSDYGESGFAYSQSRGFGYTFDRSRRVKILKKAGYEYATFSLDLYTSGSLSEKLSGLKAVTYNLENGKIVETKMKGDAVFRTKENENWTNVKFTLANVREGSIIEFSYRVNSDFDSNFRPWAFQEDIPIRWSEYRTNIPEYYSYNIHMQGYLPVVVGEKTQSTKTILWISKGHEGSGALATRTTQTETIPYQENNSRWSIQDAAAFKAEPFMNNKQDYVSKISFELAFTKYPGEPMHPYMGSWEDINNTFLKADVFGGVINGSGFLKSKVEELTSGVTDPKEKIAKIYAWVKSSVDWNGEYAKISSGNLKKVIDEKKGNSADINLMLVSMLNRADVPADPVLISTRNHGFIREGSPTSTQFNYVLAMAAIGEKVMLLDATDKSLPITMLPKRCINGKGLIISEQRSGWIDVVSMVKSRTLVFADLKFDEEGKLTGTVSLTREGYSAQEMRKDYYAKTEPTYVKEVASGNGWEIQKSLFENLERLSEAVKESHDVVISEQVQAANGTFYFNPLLNLRMTDNPFKSESREYPVDFGSPVDQVFSLRILLPEGLVVDELPKGKIIALPGNTGKFSYNVTQLGNSISITSSLSIGKSLYAQTEYPQLREFYNQVVAKQGEQIVLKKK